MYSLSDLPTNHTIVTKIEKRLKEAEDMQITYKSDKMDGPKNMQVGTEIAALTQKISHRKAILQKLKAAGEDQTAIEHDLATSLKRFARLLFIKGDHEDAKRAYKGSLKLYKQSGINDTHEVVDARAEFARLLVYMQCVSHSL